MRRAVDAHIITVQVLVDLMMDMQSSIYAEVASVLHDNSAPLDTSNLAKEKVVLQQLCASLHLETLITSADISAAHQSKEVQQF